MGFDRIFWGLLFMFDFRIQGFDILPDIVGYFLIYSGLEKLAERNGHFGEARKYALPLAVISILDIYEIKRPLTGTFDPGTFFFLAIGVIILIINLLMIYHVCSGIAEMARDKNNSELEITATKRWKFYLYVSIAMMVFLFLSAGFPPIMTILFIPLFIVSIASLGLLMGLMKQADQSF
jgi:hypothetical protein